MIKHLYKDMNVTANQLAKQMILDAIDNKACDPLGDFYDQNKMTDKEKADFYKAFHKQVDRVTKYMGKCE